MDQSGTGHKARKNKIYATSDTFSKRRFLTINYRISVESAIFQTRHDKNFKKTNCFQQKKCSYFLNFVNMKLVNKVFLIFWALIKYAKAQFNRISLSRVIAYPTGYYYR